MSSPDENAIISGDKYKYCDTECDDDDGFSNVELDMNTKTKYIMKLIVTARMKGLCFC